LLQTTKYLNILKEIDFPKVEWITIEKFLEILQKNE